MLWFRNLVLQLTAAFVMSTLSTAVLQHQWKTGIKAIVVAAVGIVLFSLAMIIAELINRWWHRRS